MNSGMTGNKVSARSPLFWVLSIIAVVMLIAAAVLGSIASAKAIEQGVFVTGTDSDGDGSDVTQEQPAPSTQETASATEMATWEIEADRIGPIRLGDAVDEVQRVVPWAQAPVEGENFHTQTSVYGEIAGYTWTPLADDSSRDSQNPILIIELDAASTVISIEVGHRNTLEVDEIQNGDMLPSVRGVRVGDAASAMRDSFPGGTMQVLSEDGVSQYVVTDRDAHALTFTLTPIALDEIPEALSDFDDAHINSIKIEDASARGSSFDLIPYYLEEQGFGTNPSTQPTPEADTDFDTGTLTVMHRLDPWADSAIAASAEPGEELNACMRDVYRSDLAVNCTGVDHCFLNVTETEALCPAVINETLGWTLHPVPSSIDTASTNDGNHLRPVVLELTDGRVCFYNSGANTDSIDGFRTGSGACGQLDTEQFVDTLWAFPTSDSAEVLGMYFLKPEGSGYLRVGVGGGDNEPAELVDVIKIYW
ncbi:MAG: hypothetical protein ACTHXA_07170 [Gulosibacter sp.]|uniref:hypothetical protein n=1 Tax=Gulosibacter sp. TaxID=2817531 RepID=UPI003F91FF11